MCCADPPRDGHRPPRILCAGIAVRDNVFRLSHFPPPGAKLRAQEFLAVGGGCAANAAVAIARLGGVAAAASPLGGPAGFDTTGDAILAGLAGAGVDTGPCVRLDGATSPLSAILIDPSGERMIVNHRDERLSDARVSDPEALVSRFDAVLVDNRFAEFVVPLCRAARERGLPVVLDGDRPTRATSELLTACTHVVFAADGLRATAERDDLGEALAVIAQHTDAFLAVTDGENGVLWREGKTLRRLNAYAVEAIDTLGAGDVFHGAFAIALAERVKEAEALVFASAAAAIKCTRFGGIAGAPSREEVNVFLAERSPLRLTSSSG